MSNLEERIILLLSKTPNQLGRELAEKLGVDKTEVNKTLYGRLKGQVFQDKAYRWSIVKEKNFNQTKDTPPTYEKTDLAKLSRYYLACLGQEEVGISTFAYSKYGEPDYVELSQLPGGLDELISISAYQRMTGLLRNQRGRHALYLGYPTSLKLLKSKKSSWQGFMVEPVFLFEIEIEGPSQEPTLNLSFPIINQKVLQMYTNAERENLMEEMAQLEEELGIGESNDHIELDELALRLMSIRSEWPWQEEIDPSNLSHQVSIAELNKQGLFNRAVLIMTERSPFTVGLETELRQLAKLPEGAIDGTALGSWLANSVKDEAVEDQQRLLEVLPMNLEQYTAVESAMSKPLSVITGPPGTGKSQVVTNLLINAAWQGKRVLFASKNNKAVDVVETRINNLGPRPTLLRVGANQYQTRLAEYLMGLMSATASKDDSDDFDEAMRIHALLQKQLGSEDKLLNELINTRNKVDHLEQDVEDIRQKLSEESLKQLRNFDLKELEKYLNEFNFALENADKKKQSLFVRLLWELSKKHRINRVNESLQVFRQYLAQLSLTLPNDLFDELNLSTWYKFHEEAKNNLNFCEVMQQYYKALSELQQLDSLETISRRRLELLQKIASNSENLWRYWLRLQPSRLTTEDRQMLNRYTALLKMVLDTGLDGKLSTKVYREYHSLFPKVSHLLSCWAVTSLSAKGKIPFEPGFFDLVVFDEASQCDIASAIPLLYRAKKAVVIGDPKQLSHISAMKKGQDQNLLDKFDLLSDFPQWAFSVNSLFDLAAGLVAGESVVSLLDHHRSHADVIEFSNKQFYEGRLRVATRYDHLKRPAPDEPGVSWVDVEGVAQRPSTGGAINNKEVEAVIQKLIQLVQERKYQGTIGVVSPFRAQVNAIRVAVEKNDSLSSLLVEREFLVDTVHRFQGDERDIIIFSPVVSSGISSGSLVFLNKNGNLFNVAITRARAQLIVVGDLAFCGQCKVDYLENFASYSQTLLTDEQAHQRSFDSDLGAEYPHVSNPEQVSDWERTFYKALYANGIKTIPQFRVEKYALDFALFVDDRKLNIEVDGERYHRNWTGELCRRDQIRNHRMFELDWDVMRFWVYEIRDDLDGCIEKVKQWVNLL